jgi:hypothetical protein
MLRQWRVQIWAVAAGVLLAGAAVAQTSVLRDAAQRERQQKEASDAELMQQAARNFVVVAPGVVRDKTTGLEWMRCSIGQDWSEKEKTCQGSADKYTFDGAQDIARRLNNAGGYNGKRDWRVPTKDELASLVVCTKGRSGSSCVDGSLPPTIAQTMFPRTADEWFWSSSPYVGNSNGAWFVDFNDGFVSNNFRGFNVQVRLVRASQ